MERLHFGYFSDIGRWLAKLQIAVLEKICPFVLREVVFAEMPGFHATHPVQYTSRSGGANSGEVTGGGGRGSSLRWCHVRPVHEVVFRRETAEAACQVGNDDPHPLVGI